MAEYIEREAAIMTAMNYDGNGTAQDASQDIAAALGCIPAADVVEVVRCKDCKYCKVECGNYCCYVDDYLKMPTPHYGDFYCAYGERRVNDG